MSDSGYVKLARLMIEQARQDLDFSKYAPKRDRISAYNFFTDPHSNLGLFCAWLGLDREAVLEAAEPLLTKARAALLDNGAKVRYSHA